MILLDVCWKEGKSYQTKTDLHAAEVADDDMI